MRIKSIAVRDFRAIAQCELKLGPGLNVIYGPNDLGKSTLAEALRAAFLVQTGAKYGESLQPWGSAATPTVIVEFESDDVAWRLTKSFGSGSRGNALLEVSKNDHPYRTDAKGRSVDGKLRELLAWGLPAPGGRGRGGNKPTFLVTALLGNQGEVDSIFSSTLEDDPVSSGRDLITQSLDVVGQDPMVARLLEHLATKLNKVISLDTGRERRTETSPLVKSASRVREAERKHEKLENDRRSSADTMASLRDAVGQRDVQLGLNEDAQRALAELEARAKIGERRKGVDATAADAEAALQRANEAERAVQQKRADIHAARAVVAKRNDALEAAKTTLKEHTDAVEKAREAVRNAEAEVDKVAAVAQTAREKQTLEIQQQIDAANRQLEAVARARRAGADATSRGEAVAQLDAQFDEQSREVKRGVLVLNAREIQAKLDALDAAKQHAAAAATQLDAARVEANKAAEALRSAEGVVKTLEETLTKFRAQHESNLASDQRRAAELQKARAALMDIEGRERKIGETQNVLRKLSAHRAQLEEAEAGIVAHDQQVQELAKRLTENEVAAEQARDSIRADEQLLIAQRLLLAKNRLAELCKREDAAKATSAEVEAARRTLSEMSEKAEGRVQIQAAQIERFRILHETKVNHAEAEPKSAAFPLGAAIGAAVVGGALAVGVLAAADGFGPLAIAAGIALAVVGFFATGALLRNQRLKALRGTWALRGQDLENQWRAEVVPTLRAASVADPNALDAYREETERLRKERAAAEAELRRSEGELAKATVSRDVIDAAQREADDLSAQLPAEARDGALHCAGDAPAPDAIRSRIESVKRTLQQLADDRQKLVEQSMQVKTTREAQAARKASIHDELATLSAQAGDRTDAAALAAEAQQLAEQRNECQKSIDKLEATTAAETSEAQRQLSEHNAKLEHAKTVVAEQSEQATRSRENLAKAESNCATAKDAVRENEAVRFREELEGLSVTLNEIGTAELPSEEAVNHDSVAVARQALEELKGKRDGERALLAEADREARKLLANLGATPEAVESEVNARLAELNERLERVECGETAKKQNASAEQLRNQLEVAQEAAKGAKERHEQVERERVAAAADLDRLSGELKILEKTAAELSIEDATKSLEEARKAAAELPSTDPVSDQELEQARHAVKQSAARLRGAEGQLRELQGKLQHVGGAVLDERLAEQEQIVERQRQRHRELEDEYAGYKLLYDTLKDLDANRATHLGRTLAKPISAKFIELAGERYDDLKLDPSLRAEGIVAAGAIHQLADLSVGTREQLASLVRLAIAEHLGTAVVLDDQLVHSDEDRLRWFRTELERAAEKVQVVVFTCRPSDYLSRPLDEQNGARLTRIDLGADLLRRHEIV